MKATVELLEGQSHASHGSGRKFTRDRPQTLTDPAEIALYEGNSRFSVHVHATQDEPAKDEPPKPAKVTTAAKPPKAPKAVAPLSSRGSSRGQLRKPATVGASKPTKTKAKAVD